MASTETVETRAPIGVWYVLPPTLPVRTAANDTAEIIATYNGGEAMSVLAQQGEWAEVRTGDRSGWVRMSDLQTSEQMKSAEENPTPKFARMPLPVSAPSARGEIYIEADVNTDGDVTVTRVITNTTGSDALANQNADALKAAKFHPITQQGERKPFKYYHRVTY